MQFTDADSLNIHIHKALFPSIIRDIGWNGAKSTRKKEWNPHQHHHRFQSFRIHDANDDNI